MAEESTPEHIEPEVAVATNVPKLHHLDDEGLYQLAKHEEDIDCAGAAAEIRALRQALEIAHGDAEKWQQEHSNACGTIAMMHACAVGDRNGPRAGVVEDIINLRQFAIKSRIALDTLIELNEKMDDHIEKLTKARDALGAMLLSKLDPKNDIERARVQAALKVGNAVEETTTIIQG